MEADGTEPRLYWTVNENDEEKVSWLNLAEGGVSIWQEDADGKLQRGARRSPRAAKDPIYGLDVSQPQLHNERAESNPLTSTISR